MRTRTWELELYAHKCMRASKTVQSCELLQQNKGDQVILARERITSGHETTLLYAVHCVGTCITACVAISTENGRKDRRSNLLRVFAVVRRAQDPPLLPHLLPQVSRENCSRLREGRRYYVPSMPQDAPHPSGWTAGL